MKHLLLLFLLYPLFIYSQYCPALGPDQLLPCGVNSTTLTADLSQCGPGGPNPNQTTNYGVTNIPYAPQANAGALVQLGDDAISQPLNIGFTFCFFGNTYTQFWIGSNGWIGFSGGQPATFASVAIPNGGLNVPKNCIMGPWQDWHPGIGGQIRYQTSGVAPCRKLTVSWIGVPMYLCTNLQGTFHIVIYESTNVIENHIQSKPSCPQWASGTAVQGVHNLPGTIGITVPGRNSTQWTTQNNSYRWTPSGAPVPAVLTWYQVGNPVAIGTGPTITVTPPPAGANYTCHFVYPICNAGWSTCNALAGGNLGPDTVFVQPGPPQLPPPNLVLQDPHCNNGCDGSIIVTPNGGTGVTTISWNGGLTNLTLNNLCSGSYNFSLIDQAGCTYNGSALLNNPLPLTPPVFSQTNPICQSYCDGQATATPSSGVGPWSWLWGNNQVTQTATALCAGQYTVTISDVWGCPATGTVTLIDPPATLVSPIMASDTVCFGSLLDLYQVTNQPGYLYTWSTVGLLVSGQGTSTVGIDWSGEPVGYNPGAVQVTAYNQSGCASLPAIFDLTIFNILPVITQIGPFCSDEPCEDLVGLPNGGIFTIAGIPVTQFCPQFNTGDSVLYSYFQSGCLFDDTTTFVVNPQPIILSIGPLNTFLELCEGDTTSMSWNITSSLPGGVDWTFQGQSLNSGLSQTFGISNFGTFLVTATLTTPEGCVSATQTTSITVQECPNTLIYIPNTFTPDGNQYNQTWAPVFTQGFDPAEFQMTVFNRWGMIVWESLSHLGEWDGTWNNNKCQDGVYTYRVWFGDPKTDAKYNLYGHFTLIR